MKIELSEFYKKKGYKSVYIVINRENRRMACLTHKDGTRKTTSYAKYLYTSHYECDIAEGDHVDHINGDKTDDRIENLQVISKGYNIRKDHLKKEMVLCICPVCGTEFLIDKRNLKFHPNPCCSRSCGGKQSIITARINFENNLKQKLNYEPSGNEYIDKIRLRLNKNNIKNTIIKRRKEGYKISKLSLLFNAPKEEIEKLLFDNNVE